MTNEQRNDKLNKHYTYDEFMATFFPNLQECPRCGGWGKVRRRAAIVPYRLYILPCPDCEGQGLVEKAAD